MSQSIHTAAQNKQYSLVLTLITTDPNLVNTPDGDGRTALHWASSSGALDIVKILIDNGAVVDQRDASGWSALHIAVSAGQEDVVRELVGAGADVSARNNLGITPLHYAASKSHVDIGKFLIARGADINAKDKANQVPLHRAATTGSTAFIQLLLNPPEGSQKTRLNTADRVGNTPLHLAMESGHANAAIMLIRAGADRDRLNQDGLAPEDVEGVGEPAQARMRAHVADQCGKR